MNKITEKQNFKSKGIDLFTTEEILKLINEEDMTIASKISPLIPNISLLINRIVKQLSCGGRLFYIGCGTSGRLGVLDAAECPPTFSVNTSLVQGLIAGGKKALIKSVENAEDSLEDGMKIIVKKNISTKDVIIGISASGTALYVRGALMKAKTLGAHTGLICCNNIKKESHIDYLFPIIVGPEIITGSTRMKAGTATKMLLNMISTTAMIKMNKVYDNLMIDLKMSNKKLNNRAEKIISEITGKDIINCREYLSLANGNIKIAIIMLCKNIKILEAELLLKQHSNNLKDILSK